MASPFSLNVKDPQRDLVDPAVQGTINVLTACKENHVKKVVLTSSMAAITDHPDKTYTEEDWNTLSSLKRNPYYFSKKLAEESAWNFVRESEEKGEECFKLVVINPFIVIGPGLSIQGGNNESNSLFKGLLEGGYPALMRVGWGLVDVRDVALAHVLAMENNNANGRYICANRTLWMKEVVEFMQQHYADWKLPKSNLECGFGSHLIKFMANFQEKGIRDYLRTNLDTFPEYDNGKIRGDLGIEFRDVYDSIKDTTDYLIESGIAVKK